MALFSYFNWILKNWLSSVSLFNMAVRIRPDVKVPEKQKQYSFGLISTLNPYVGSGRCYPGTTGSSHHHSHSLLLVCQNSRTHGRHWSFSRLDKVGWRGSDAKCIGYIRGGKVIHLIIEQNPSSFSSDSWAKPEKQNLWVVIFCGIFFLWGGGWGGGGAVVC